MNASNPSWQGSPCPIWCKIQHAEADKDGNRDHMSGGVYLPVILLASHPDTNEPDTRESIQDDIVLAVFQRQNQSPTCVTIGISEDGRACLDISHESDARLVDALAQLLAQTS